MYYQLVVDGGRVVIVFRDLDGAGITRVPVEATF